jgi:predicted ATPase
MIESIYLKHFKCFDEKTVELSGLTVLAGPNSSGKSTIIQGLSVLMQTAVEARYSAYLALNGQHVSLGSFSDVVNIHKARSEFSLGLGLYGDSVHWTFTGESGALSGARVRAVDISHDGENLRQTELDRTTLDCLTPFQTQIAAAVSQTLLDTSHLTADRKSGEEIHHFFERRTNGFGEDRIDVGAHGEAAMSLLMTAGEKPLKEDDPRVIETEARSLLPQVRAWMGKLFPGASLDAIPVETSSFFRLRFQSHPLDRFRRPASVGYGFAQVFPLVVLCLAATEQNTLLIENPEVHLHPAAQSRVGEFIGACAAAGVQIVLETHSDHVINGIRKAVASRSGLADRVVFYSIFNDPAHPGEAELEEILIDEKGSLSKWPKGFFDQAVSDARSLVLGEYDAQ